MNLKRSNSKFNNYSLMKIFSYYKKYLLSTLLLMYCLILSLLIVTTSNAQKIHQRDFGKQEFETR